MINFDMRVYWDIFVRAVESALYIDTLNVVVKSMDIDDFKIHIFVFSIQMITKTFFLFQQKMCIVC